MTAPYKPAGYNSVHPYFVVDDAQRLIEFLQEVFGGLPLRHYTSPAGKIVHSEVKIDDSILMLADASAHFPQRSALTHLYVSDVDAVFQRARATGCTILQEPIQHPEDPDRRGAFEDFAGNIWTVATQIARA